MYTMEIIAVYQYILRIGFYCFADGETKKRTANIFIGAHYCNSLSLFFPNNTLSRSSILFQRLLLEHTKNV